MARWGKERSGKPREVPKFPPLRREDGSMATTFEQKIERLRKAFFPPPPLADLEDIRGTD